MGALLHGFQLLPPLVLQEQEYLNAFAHQSCVPFWRLQLQPFLIFDLLVRLLLIYAQRLLYYLLVNLVSLGSLFVL